MNERTTPIVTLAFTDENGDPVAPMEAFYRIDDCQSGTEITGDTEIVSPGVSEEIVLSQAETAILDENHEYETRRVTVWWSYGPLGDKHGNGQYFLRIKNLGGITAGSPP